MSHLHEVVRAVAVARQGGTTRIAVLHCVSAYPTPASSENLRAISTLGAVLDLPVGLSDHSSGGLMSAIAAVALGACVYERHLMLDGDADAIDSAVSSTPEELQAIVAAMERVRVSLGDGRKRCQPAEAPNVTPSRRGLYAKRALRAGERLRAADVVALRPATDVSPADLPLLLERPLTRDLRHGEPFTLADLPLEKAS
jgi:N-acetylneuraminate synthase/N,N'-diacetyllegionaminate synthase